MASENGLIARMEEKFVTKEEFELKLSLLKTEVTGEIKTLRIESRFYFFVILIVIFLTNPHALDLILRIVR